MNSTRRLIVILGLVVVAAVGFVVLKGTEDTSDDQPAPVVSAPASTATTPAADGAPEPRAPAETTPRRAAAPAVPTIVVRDGEPVGGVKELVFRKGDRIAFDVRADAPDDVHLHVYDVELPVGPDAPARFRLDAEIEGIFEAELHGAHTQIGSITVEP